MKGKTYKAVLYEVLPHVIQSKDFGNYKVTMYKDVAEMKILRFYYSGSLE